MHLVIGISYNWRWWH